MFHPAFCLRSPSNVDLWVSDLIKARSFKDAGFESREQFVTEEVESIKPFLQGVQAVGLDTETQGFDWMSPNSFIISYSVAVNEFTAYQVFLHELGDTEDKIKVSVDVKTGRRKETKSYNARQCSNFENKIQDLITLLEDPDIKKYMMNGNYDLHHISTLCERTGFRQPVVRNYVMDIQTASHLLNENVFMRTSLEFLRKTYNQYFRYLLSSF